MSEDNGTQQAGQAPSVSVQDAINYLANYALRSPINPAEHQTILHFRDVLLKMCVPPPAPATAAIDERFEKAAKAAKAAKARG